MSSSQTLCQLIKGIRSCSSSHMTVIDDYDFHSHVWTYSNLKSLPARALSAGIKSPPFTVQFQNLDWKVVFICTLRREIRYNNCYLIAYINGTVTSKAEEITIEVKSKYTIDDCPNVTEYEAISLSSTTVKAFELFSTSWNNNDKLAILFSVAPAFEKRMKVINYEGEEWKVPSTQQDLGQVLLVNGEFSDIELTCGGESFKAHRAVLAARSKVFAAKFTNWDDEKKPTMEVTEFTPQVLSILLNFMYTGSIPDPSLSHEIIFGADYYELEPLKELCVEHLKRSLTLDNAWSRLAIAERLSADDLKKSVYRFFLDHKASFSTDEDLQTLTKLAPSIRLELWSSLMTGKI